MAKTEPVVPVLDAWAVCGETPVRDAAAKVLYWIDAGAILALRTGVKGVPDTKFAG